jgi:tetratricopeptide (TPR) repeat protein
LAAGIFLLALGGCATPQLQALVEHGATGIPPRAELDTVPFFAQDDHQCGPAALAMVLGTGGKSVTPETLRPEMYLPDREGTLQVEMLAAARRNGFVAVELNPRLPDVLAEIAAGNPVIILHNLGLSWYPVWHYSVAVGYDLESQRIVLRSGREPRLEMSLRTFEYTWKRSGYWAMLASPPRRVPASLSAPEYLGGVAKLEQIGQRDAARAAYGAALERWPDNLVAFMGLGNTSYAAGDLKAAEMAFRRATLAHPEAAAAHNNLAQTLAELGRYDEAAMEARTAVGLGGPLKEASLRTLDTVIAHSGRGRQQRAQ